MSLYLDDEETVSYDQWLHLDHCIDQIRQSLMCNADTSAQGFDWFPEEKYLRIRLDSVHRCRNWDLIHEWADEHVAPWNGNIAHVDETTGRVVDYGKDPNDDNTNLWVPAGFQYTRHDM